MSAKALNCGHGSAERITIYHSGEGNCEACRVERFLGTDPFADDVERRDSAVAVGQEVKCPTCGEWILEGETCEDCQRERKMDTGQWGPAIDRLARAGYSPHIEHFKGAGPRSGYRVSIWPSVDEPRIDIGYAGTFERAVELLLNWKIPA